MMEVQVQLLRHTDIVKDLCYSGRVGRGVTNISIYDLIYGYCKRNFSSLFLIIPEMFMAAISIAGFLLLVSAVGQGTRNRN